MPDQKTKVRPPLRTRVLRTLKRAGLTLTLIACNAGPMSEGPRDAGADRTPPSSPARVDDNIKFADSTNKGIPVCDSDGGPILCDEPDGGSSGFNSRWADKIPRADEVPFQDRVDVDSDGKDDPELTPTTDVRRHSDEEGPKPHPKPETDVRGRDAGSDSEELLFGDGIELTFGPGEREDPRFRPETDVTRRDAGAE